MRTLPTGCDEFIGSYTLDRLLACGRDAINF